jgi:S1-C subfamily serine protease
MKTYVMSLTVVLSALLTAGMTESPAPTRLDEVLGLKTAPGAFIIEVNPGSAAEQAGLDVCQLIAAFNNQAFRDYGDSAGFVAALREAAMSSGAGLQVWKSSDSGRTYERDRTRVRIASQPEAKIGMSITLQVLVVAVIKRGPADVAGVEAGEFIDQVNGQRVSNMRSIADLDQRISEAADHDGEVRLTLARWKPVRNSATYKTGFETREVVVRIGG